MALFGKKCAICGGKAGMLSNKAIQGGVICGDCAGKLSPFFDGFKSADATQIATQIQAREQNRVALERFQPTKAWGVKKYQVAMQFIYDAEQRAFVVVEGPEESFRERNPDIIRFDQVRDVWLEVVENWSEDGGQYAPNGVGQLLQDRYKEVFWRYDFILHIELSHPYLREIAYPMNFKTTVMQVPQRGFVYRRGLEMGGEYRGEDISALANALDRTESRERTSIDLNRKLDVVLLRRKSQSLGEKIIQGFEDEVYLKKIDNMCAHVRRAERIRALTLGL